MEHTDGNACFAACFGWVFGCVRRVLYVAVGTVIDWHLADTTIELKCKWNVNETKCPHRLFASSIASLLFLVFLFHLIRHIFRCERSNENKIKENNFKFDSL